MGRKFSVKTYIDFRRDLKQFKALMGSNPDFVLAKNKAILGEKTTESGIKGGHYFHQDLLVARRIFANQPVKHIDIGSRTDGFVAHVASFREIEVFDIRSFSNTIANIKFVQADLMKLNPDLINYTDSISSLHAIEHFGLGRYGISIIN